MICPTNYILGVDENACILFKYKDGAMADLMYHTTAGTGENNAVIYGDKGKIQVYETRQERKRMQMRKENRISAV